MKCLSMVGSPPVIWSQTTPASRIMCSRRTLPGHASPENSFKPR